MAIESITTEGVDEVSTRAATGSRRDRQGAIDQTDRLARVPLDLDGPVRSPRGCAQCHDAAGTPVNQRAFDTRFEQDRARQITGIALGDTTQIKSQPRVVSTNGAGLGIQFDATKTISWSDPGDRLAARVPGGQIGSDDRIEATASLLMKTGTGQQQVQGQPIDGHRTAVRFGVNPCQGAFPREGIPQPMAGRDLLEGFLHCST